MDHSDLQGFLEEGLSLAEIGKRAGLHETTVSYWVRKHGLQAVGQEKYTAKGPLQRVSCSL